MKLFIVLAIVALAQADKLDNVYLPPNAQASAGSGQFLQTPQHSSAGSHSGNAYASAPAFGQNAYSGAPAPNAFGQNAYSSAPASNGFAQSGYPGAAGSNAFSGYQARPERPQAAFDRNAVILRQDFNNDVHSYSYAYETSNGIRADESGVTTHGTQAQGGYSYTGDDGKLYSVRYTADENGYVPQGDHLPTPPPIPEAILKSLELIARKQAAGGYDNGAYNSGDNQQQYYNSNAQPANYNGNAAGVEKAYLPPF